MSFSLKKIGCAIIGWDYQTLKECTETSQQQFRKYVSAVLIMMTLWGTIGYCFADKYMGISAVVGKIFVALVFVAIITCIERIIIMSRGSRLMTIARIFMALCMALIGACIFDQIIFSNDMEHTIQDNREQLVKSTVSERLSIFEADNNRMQHELDSLNNAQRLAQEKYAADPAKVIDAWKTVETPVVVNGVTVMQSKRVLTQEVIESPLKSEIDRNSQIINDLTQKLDKVRDDIKLVDDKVRNEIMSRPVGFLEELNATISVICTSWVTLTFYLLMMIFMLSLEFFVLTLKHGDEKCDYITLIHKLEEKRIADINARNGNVKECSIKMA